MFREFGKYLLIFILLILAQVLVFNNIEFSGFMNPYIYVLFVLLLPFNTPKLVQLLSSFALVLIHHFALFYLEVFTFHHFFSTFLRALLSSVLTSLIIILSQFFIFR